MLNRTALIVARREFIERVRTKWFVIVTLLGPLLMVATLVLPAYLSIKSAQEGFRMQLVDNSGRDIGAMMNLDLDAKGVTFKIESVPNSTTTKELERRIRDEEIDGYLILPEDILEGGKVIYRGDNTANLIVTAGLSRLIDVAVFRTRGEDLQLNALEIATLLQEVEFDFVQTTGHGEVGSGKASFIVGFAVVFILYISIVLYAVAVLRSVILEKNNRVVEMIVSSIRPVSLMVGKILGVGCVGLLQLAIWGIIAGIIVTFHAQILELFGVPGAAAINLPNVDTGAIFVILAYFILGFFFYAALFAAIGASVSSEQEAQQAQTPFMLLLTIPVLCVQIVAGDPRGGVAEVLTQIPFSSPVLMPMRYVLDAASAGEIILSLSILVLCLLGTIAVAAKIYRVGILSYGKKPTIAELWRWLRS